MEQPVEGFEPLAGSLPVLIERSRDMAPLGGGL